MWAGEVMSTREEGEGEREGERKYSIRTPCIPLPGLPKISSILALFYDSFAFCKPNPP
jgi:hypothetical protein